MRGEQRPAWGMLYLWSGLMVGALVAEQWLPLSHHGHKLFEICGLLVWGMVVARWCRRHRAALEAMAEQQDRAHRTSAQSSAAVELTPVQAHYRQVMEQRTAKK